MSNYELQGILGGGNAVDMHRGSRLQCISLDDPGASVLGNGQEQEFRVILTAADCGKIGGLSERIIP